MNNIQSSVQNAPSTLSESYNQEADIVFFPGLVEDFIETIPDNTVNLIITSPPYNLGKEYEKRVEIEEYLETQNRTIAQLYRVLREDGSICWQVGNYVKDGEVFPLDIYYYRFFKDLGMFLRNRIIWRYGHGLHASNRFSGRYETILWFTKSNNYIFNLDPVRIPAKYPGKLHSKGPNRGKPSGNPKGKNPSDVWEMIINEWEACFWDIPNVKASHREKTIHPCQFPVELAERCVLALTNERGIVLDPYTGVGSSLIAAIKHNRRAVGCEKEIDYVRIAHERINDYYKGSLPLRPLGKPLFNPDNKEKVAQVPEAWETDKTTIYYNGT